MQKRWVLTALAVVLGSVAFAPQARAQVIVVPNANATVEGNSDNRFPFLVNGGQRYQQVFAASQFAGLGGPSSITSIALRNTNSIFGVPFTSTISNIQIFLSTTAAGPDALSTTFANNLGADATQVYSGSLTLSSTNAPGPGDTRVFDVVINFQTPFLYDPSQGNLLLDVRNLSGANAFVGTNFFDAVNTLGDPISRVFGPEGNPGAATGIADTSGLVVQFSATAIPEPASVTLAGVGLLGLCGYGLRRLRRKPA